MKPTNDLFDLVKKLTKSEKRYFKLNASVHPGEKVYLKIFQEVDRMEEYDEKLLKKRLRGQTDKVTQLHVAKNHLAQSVLKSLRLFNERNVVEQKLFARMSEAGILEQKGLYKQCLKRLNAAKKTAEKYEMHHYLLDIFRREILLNLDLLSKGIEDFVARHYEKIGEIHRRLQVEIELNRLLHLVFIAYRAGRTKESLAKVEQLENHPLLRDDFLADSFLSKLNYFFVKALIHAMKGDVKKASDYHKKVMEVWNRHRHFMELHPKLYKIHLSNFLTSLLWIEDYSPFEAGLKNLKSLPDNTFDEEASSFSNYHFLALLFYLNTGKPEKATALVPEIEEGLKKYKAKISKSRELIFYHNIFLLYFSLENYDEAYKWLMKITSGKKTEIRTEVQLFARVMQLVLHFELKNYRYLEDLYSSVYRGLKKIDKLHEFERAVLKHVKDFSPTLGKKERKRRWEEFLKAMEKIEKQAGGKRILGLEELIIWAESKVQGSPYLMILNERKGH